jgi:hypothetical protein
MGELKGEGLVARVHAHPRSMGPKMGLPLRYFGLPPAQPLRLAGHFGDNNLEQQLLALIFGRILILLKLQLQCISVYAVAYSCLG